MSNVYVGNIIMIVVNCSCHQSCIDICIFFRKNVPRNISCNYKQQVKQNLYICLNFLRQTQGKYNIFCRDGFLPIIRS